VVTVVDNTKPTVITQNINAYLDATGNVTITPAQVNNGSYVIALLTYTNSM
jgi:hypothetical protein